MHQSIERSSVTFEHHWSGQGIGTESPTISWRFDSAAASDLHGWTQYEYEIQISESASETGEVHYGQGAQPIHVPWPTTALQSCERSHVQARASGRWGSPSDEMQIATTSWSSWYAVECALLKTEDWIVRPVAAPEQKRTEGPLRPLLFRKVFSVSSQSSPVGHARLYITAQGVYRPFISGVQVSDQKMAPGWTGYKHGHCFQTLDVTKHLREGTENVIRIEVAEGWYCGRLGFLGGRRHLYGDKMSVLAQLEIEYQDGSCQFCNTGEEWKCSQSPIMSSEIYDGEMYDMSKEQPEWLSNHDFDDSNWANVEYATQLYPNLTVSHAPSVKFNEVLKPVEIIRTPSGKTVVDFGQNLVRKLRVRHLSAEPGRKISFQHVEILEAEEPAIRPLRGAKSLDTVVMRDRDLHEWTPAFTFHGLRYVAVGNWSCEDDETPLTLDSISALVMHSDMTRTGCFHCSNDLVNKLHENTVWSMRGNFVSIPMDCPQRDERLGWTGDI